MQLNQISYTMGRKFKLLPHWCQIVGYTYILGLLLCFAYALVYTMGIFPEDCGIINGINSIHKHALTHWNFVGALNFVMIFLAIFSKEKVEDEMTSSIRLNTLRTSYSLYLEFTFFCFCQREISEILSSISKSSLWRTSAYCCSHTHYYLR